MASEQARVANSNTMDGFVLDQYTSLSFKRALGDRTMGGVSWASPGWAGERNHRRLMAYKIRELYYENAARHVLPETDVKLRSNHREYGDVFLLVETVLAALLGSEQTIVVRGSEDFNEHAPDQPLQGRDQVPPDDETQAKRAALLENQLRQWSDKESFPMKLLEAERSAVKLGDGVYVLGWSGRKKRVRLRVFDPGVFFTGKDQSFDDDFPHRVHLAWETDDQMPDDSKVRVRRITWELKREGTLTLPWNDEPVDEQCFMSDGIFTLDKHKNDADVDSLVESNVTWLKNEDDQEVRDLPLGIDYIPVVHVPNTVALIRNFGRALVDSVAQIIDDLSRADTDLQQAARLAGFPPLAVGKAVLETEDDDSNLPTGGKPKTRVITYGPGTAFEIGEGTLTAVDLSNGVTVLISYVNHLIARLEVNARVPSGILGRLKPSEVPSGIALALSFGPLTTMIKEMRLVRDEKYRLLLKFVTRFMWLNDELEEEPPEAEAELVLGPYLPVDRAAIVNEVNQLMMVKAISRPTALLMLIEAGLPIEDAAKEIAAIQATDYTGANELLSATDDPQVVRDYLGIKGKAPEPIPAAPLPAGPGGPPAARPPAPNGPRPAQVPPG